MTKLRDQRISQRTVDGLSVDEKDAVFWDCDLPGFGVRVYPNGTKVYVVQTRGHGKSRRGTIGRHGPFTAGGGGPPGGRGTITIQEGGAPH
ncbi:MAG: Arm DNA-binding domain-containing protein, partial [Rhodospirillaceae bacterium]|nr:Arm DNA-binding domain-containing protein [Rhodospirillaceae bacterium]